MARPLKFRKKDYLWIRGEYPAFYNLLKNTSHPVGDEIYVELADQGAYDIIFDGTAYVLMDEVTDDGELTKDGLRFEEAWDYADREGELIGTKQKLI